MACIDVGVAGKMMAHLLNQNYDSAQYHCEYSHFETLAVGLRVLNIGHLGMMIHLMVELVVLNTDRFGLVAIGKIGLRPLGLCSIVVADQVQNHIPEDSHFGLAELVGCYKWV